MDLALSRRLERTEGTVGASFASVRRQLAPAVGSTSSEFGGTWAIFDGVESPMTQTFGLGVFDATTADALSQIEAFFESRGAAPTHEVSPLAGVETFATLVERGYRPIELSTVLVQGTDGRVEAPSAPTLRVRAIQLADHPAWIETSVTGWSDDPAIARVVRPLAEVATANATMLHYIVERDEAPIATGSMGIHDGVALLAGASTIPSGRGLGAQAMLLAARLAEARRRGCEIAMMVTEPGSTSQRNAERRGFRVAYTRTKWRRDLRPA